jgi:hypothetical protein
MDLGSMPNSLIFRSSSSLVPAPRCRLTNWTSCLAQILKALNVFWIPRLDDDPLLAVGKIDQGDWHIGQQPLQVRDIILPRFLIEEMTAGQMGLLPA